MIIQKAHVVQWIVMNKDEKSNCGAIVSVKWCHLVVKLIGWTNRSEDRRVGKICQDIWE